MLSLPGMTVEQPLAENLPSWPDIVEFLKDPARRHAADALWTAEQVGRPILQPRCGVGRHHEMIQLLRSLAPAGPGILSVTIDSYTRLRQFDTAAQQLRENPSDLNGYPLLAHGWLRGRELAASVEVPLEIRHGSPDGRDLFAVSLAAGITSFEGGGISYNLPYSKDIPLHVSLAAWQEVDTVCGQLARDGVVVDRELFGTLSAVLIPPSISLAISLLEAIAATQAGVVCLSIAYPQGGEVHQDIAALRAIRTLAARYLPPTVAIYPVLHEYMGAFPRQQSYAEALIMLGGLVGRLGGATKIVTKTSAEGAGIPHAETNAQGIRTARLGTADVLDFVQVDEGLVAEEQYWIEQEVEEIVEAVIGERGDILSAISLAFSSGRLDIPFGASIHTQSRVIPCRDPTGAIRYLDPGGLPFSTASRRHNRDALSDERCSADTKNLLGSVAQDIDYFTYRML